ncbi:MAG: hypothetical protein JWP15_20, partial [Alphaproteobacteria bacterium]|nr:hypothetical protein [Alphaproteobacteria bacterium]
MADDNNEVIATPAAEPALAGQTNEASAPPADGAGPRRERGAR